MISTDRRACSGRSGSSEVAASAWTAIRLTWCATTSCSSRAIRVRSCSAARAAWRSSSASARSARFCAASRLARLARLSVPAAHAVRKISAWKMASYGSLWPGAASEIDMPDRREPAGDPAPDRMAAVDDGVERDRGPERKRREPESDLVVGDPRAADDDHRPGRARTGARPAGRPGATTSVSGQPQRMQLGPVRQQGNDVDGGERDAERDVLDPFLAARRKRRHPGHQPLR